VNQEEPIPIEALQELLEEMENWAPTRKQPIKTKVIYRPVGVEEVVEDSLPGEESEEPVEEEETAPPTEESEPTKVSEFLPSQSVPVAAVDCGIARLGETENGLVIALRATIVIDEGEASRVILFRTGPFYLHNQYKKESLYQVGKHLGKPDLFVEIDDTDPDHPVLLKVKAGVAGDSHQYGDRFRNWLERLVQKVAVTSIENGIILFDGALTLRTRDTPPLYLERLARLASNKGNAIIAISKQSLLQIQGKPIRFWLNDVPNLPCYRCLTPLMKSEGAERAERVMGNAYAARFSVLGPTFRMDVKAVAGQSDDEAINQFYSTPIQFDGPRFNMVNVVTGVKGSGKSHLAKHLVVSLAEKGVPCIIFDINGEYVGLPNAQVLRWGDNFMPDLAEVGYRMLDTVIQVIYPLTENSRSVLSARLPQIFAQRRAYQEKTQKAFSIDIEHLRKQNWGGGDLVEGAIDRRLEIIDGMKLFAVSNSSSTNVCSKLDDLYEQACAKRPIVFDIREHEPALQTALVRAMNEKLEGICGHETSTQKGRYPFVFFEEAHFYIDETAILNIITRGRHIGMASVFITNTPQKLPDTVFRQLDNLFLLGLTHKDDIKNVSRNSFTDEETIQSLATRMPERHALIIGNVTDRYPLVVKVAPLPENIPPSGRTRSTWDRFSKVEGGFSVASSKE
jgi:hypothetical protein